MELKLVLPSKKYKEKVTAFKEAMLAAGSSMDGCGSLRREGFDEWLKNSALHHKGKNLPLGRVQATQYICIRKSDDKVVGMLQIRHKLNDFLFNYGGHIGDCIAVDERGKGYGNKIIALGLKKCKALGIDKVLITCKDTNVLSRKCIIYNGGKYEDTRHLDEENINLERYWIKLK